MEIEIHFFYLVNLNAPVTCYHIPQLSRNSGAFKNWNGPNNRNGPGITGTDLSFTYFFSISIFIFHSYI